MRTSSPKKRGSSPKRGISPVKEKPWIPAPCKTSKNKFTWAGSKGQLDITSPLPTHNDSMTQVESDFGDEPTLLENVDNYRSKVQNVSSELDFLKSRSDVMAREKEMEALRNELNTSLSEVVFRDKELGNVQQDLLHTELENERLRSSLRVMADVDNANKESQDRLQLEREALLRRLVQAEADSVSANKELSQLHDNLRLAKAEKNMCTEDMDKLSRHRELLMAKCSEAEDNNSQLRSELRQNKLLLEDSEKLRTQHDKVLDRLTDSDSKNRELRMSLADMDKQISMLSRQINAEKEEVEAYKHLQKTSELSRTRTEEQLNKSLSECTNLERRVAALEQDLDIEKREHNRTKGFLAGVRDKSHTEKDALRDKLRQYRERALRSEEALEAVSAQIEAKSLKVRSLESTEDTLTKRLDSLVQDKEELSEALDTLKRKLYLSEEHKLDAEEELKLEKSKLKTRVTETDQEILRLQARNKQLQISLDSLSDKLKDKEAVAVAAEETHDTERERLARELENLNRRLADAEDTIQRFQSDNRLLQQRVDISERERSAMQHGNYVELEKVREEYQSKLNDMALYREKLRTAEARGEDAETTSVALKSQLAQKNATIEELNIKIDTFQEQIGRLKEKFSSVSEDNIELANKAQSHEKKVMEADLHNKNLMDLVAQKDDTAEQHQLKIEELMRENAELSLQLEGTLGDCRRQVESMKERSVLKERSSTTRIDELEAQLGRATTTQSQLKRLKDEAEKRSQQRINEMRERLEQANNTTRSMQNYVNFLKQSYSSVFGDSNTSPYNGGGRLSPTYKRSPSPTRHGNLSFDMS